MKKQTKEGTNIPTLDLVKQPPNSIALEEAVLGALLLERDAFDAVTKRNIKANIFYKKTHQIIFQSMLDLRKKSSPIDLLTVRTELERNQILEKIGGAYAVVRLTTEVSSSSNVEYHLTNLTQLFLLRSLGEIGYMIYEQSYQGKDSDPFEIINSAMESFAQMTSSIQNNVKPAWSIQKTALDNALTARKQFRSDGIAGISTGIKEIDKITGGLKAQDLIIIAARPSHGKTAFLVQLINIICNTKKGIFVFFSLEMSEEKITIRINCNQVDVSYKKMLDGDFSDEEYDKVAASELPLNCFITDKANATKEYIYNTTYSLYKKYGKIAGFGVDYLQYMQPENGEQTHQYLGSVANHCKRMAKEFDCPSFLLTQTSRAAEERKVSQLAHLKDSGVIEQAADVIIFIESLYNWDIKKLEDGRDTRWTNEDGNKMAINKIRVAKNRNGGIGSREVINEIEYCNYYSDGDKFYLQNLKDKRVIQDDKEYMSKLTKDFF